MQRTNEQWLAELQSTGPNHESALTDLRAGLVRGLGFALRDYLSPVDPNYSALVEESVQDALLKIVGNLDSFRGHSKFTTWAHKIAIHVALTELRRKRWQDTSLENLLQTDNGVMTPGFIADPGRTPEQATLQADLLARVHRIIAQDLTEKQRTALVATRVNGVPMSQVAAAMDMKPNALYKLLHDARLRLKKTLAEEGLTPEDVLAAFDD